MTRRIGERVRPGPRASGGGLLLALTLLAGIAAASAQESTDTLADVPFSDPDATCIAASIMVKILQPSDGCFHPDKTVNRYQWAVILARLGDELKAPVATRGALPLASGEDSLAGPVPPASELLPPDVPKDHWAALAVRVSAARTGWDLHRPFDGQALLTEAQTRADLTSLLRRLGSTAGGFPETSDGRARVTRRRLARLGMEALGRRLGPLETYVVMASDCLALMNVMVAKLEDSSAAPGGPTTQAQATWQDELQNLDSRLLGLVSDSEQLSRLAALHERTASSGNAPDAQYSKDVENLGLLVAEFGDEVKLLGGKLQKLKLAGTR
ncbi:MAG: hypothetical protein HY814_04755 [Candidatus Riflebacteria bacterium]|nr:hypothetical protein [Candidatus Riflebacteria bacterium]